MVNKDGNMDWKVITFVASTALAAGYGGGTVSKSNVLTAIEGDLLKRELRIEIREVEQGIRRDMPPIETRNRIRNIEQFIGEQHPEFSHEYDWK